MFEYGKEILTKKANELDCELRSLSRKKEANKNRIESIFNFESLASELKERKFFTVSFLAISCYTALRGMTSASLGFIFATGLPLAFSIYNGTKLLKTNRELKKLLPKYLAIAEIVLGEENSLKLGKKKANYKLFKKKVYEQILESLDNEDVELSSKYDNVKVERETIEEALEKIVTYEYDCEYFSKFKGFCTCNAKNAQEFYQLLEECQEYEKISLDQYLEENKEYSSIPVVSDLGEEIQYTEASKKLLKKI